MGTFRLASEGYVDALEATLATVATTGAYSDLTGLPTIPSLTSGTYTPTRSAEANTDSNVTMSEAQYLRVGATVTVSGRFTDRKSVV